MIYIRNLRPDDEIGYLFDSEMPLKWNPNHVFVAEKHGVLIGIAIVFDAGHEMVLVDHIRAIPEYRGVGLWLRFMKHIAAHYKPMGRKYLFGYANNPVVIGIAERFGTVVGTEPHYSLTKGL